MVAEAEGKVYDQAFFVEWIPHFCQKCQVLGHKSDLNKSSKSSNAFVAVPKHVSTQLVLGPSSVVPETDGGCDGEEEWVKATNQKKAKGVLLGSEVGSTDSINSGNVEGAGIPLNPILVP